MQFLANNRGRPAAARLCRRLFGMNEGYISGNTVLVVYSGHSPMQTSTCGCRLHSSLRSCRQTLDQGGICDWRSRLVAGIEQRTDIASLCTVTVSMMERNNGPPRNAVIGDRSDAANDAWDWLWRCYSYAYARTGYSSFSCTDGRSIDSYT